MRTRSEWFLGPECVGSMEISSCNNCCLIHDRDDFVGGSTNDVHERMTSVDNEMCLLFKRRQQHEPQKYYTRSALPHSPHYQHQPEYMDTDESGEFDHHSTALYFSPDTAVIERNKEDRSCSSAAAQIYLETNFSTISGSYDEINNSFNNNFNNQLSVNNNFLSFDSAKNNFNNHHKKTVNHEKMNKQKSHQANHNRLSIEHSAYLQSPDHIISHYFSPKSIPCCDSRGDINVVDEFKFFGFKNTNLPNGIKDASGHTKSPRHTIAAHFYGPKKHHLSKSAHNLTHVQIDPLSNHAHHSNNILMSSKAACISRVPDSTLAAHGSEEVDYVLTSRFRHSTPIARRRSRRQRFPSTSTQHLTSLRNRAVDSSNGGRGGATAGSANNNFVTVLFNVLDFLF